MDAESFSPWIASCAADPQHEVSQRIPSVYSVQYMSTDWLAMPKCKNE